MSGSGNIFALPFERAKVRQKFLIFAFLCNFFAFS